VLPEFVAGKGRGTKNSEKGPQKNQKGEIAFLTTKGRRCRGKGALGGEKSNARTKLRWGGGNPGLGKNVRGG